MVLSPSFQKGVQQRNWPLYNRNLQNRASINMFVDVDSIQTLWLSEPKSGDLGKGRPQVYSDYAIRVCLSFGAAFRLPLRQTHGFVKSLMMALKVNIPLPDYTLLCLRMKRLDIKIAMRSIGVADCSCLILDATGLKMAGEGE